MRRSIILLSVIAVLVTACGASDDPGPTIDPVDDESTDESTDAGDDPLDDPNEETDDMDNGATDDAATGSDAMLGPEVAQVVADAAERADVAEDEVLVTVTELVVWPDGAIGCPEPDMMYTQALVDGYRIVVEAGGTSYTYHGQDGSDPFHCERPQDPADVR